MENKKNEKLDQVMNQLEQGVKSVYTSEQYAAYLACMGKFRRYSVNNSILIWRQCPEASLVAGFRAWQEQHKRHVKKGEKAIYILAPCPKKRTVEAVDPETGEKYMKEIRWNTYRPVCVFDVSQTEGEPLPSICDPLTGAVERFEELFARLEAVSPVPVAFENIKGGANGFYSHTENRIVIQSGMAQEQTIKTTIHEIAHAILHNKQDGEEKNASRHVKEVQAESVAFVVCNALGLDTSSYSFGYIAGWAAGQDAKDLTNNLDVIRKTANTLIDALTAEGTPVPEAAPAKASEAPEKAEKKAPKKQGKKQQKKQAPKKDKALEKWTESAGKRFDKLAMKRAALHQNVESGCFFGDYYNPYWCMFIPKTAIATYNGEDNRASTTLDKFCTLTEQHKPVVEVTPGTSAKGLPVSRYTNSEGVQMWVNDKFRRYFPKAAKAYLDKRIGTLVLTLGEGENETVIGCILPINIPADGRSWTPNEEAKAA